MQRYVVLGQCLAYDPSLHYAEYTVRERSSGRVLLQRQYRLSSDVLWLLDNGGDPGKRGATQPGAETLQVVARINCALFLHKNKVLATVDAFFHELDGAKLLSFVMPVKERTLADEIAAVRSRVSTSPERWDQLRQAVGSCAKVLRVLHNLGEGHGTLSASSFVLRDGEETVALVPFNLYPVDRLGMRTGDDAILQFQAPESLLQYQQGRPEGDMWALGWIACNAVTGIGPARSLDHRECLESIFNNIGFPAYEDVAYVGAKGYSILLAMKPATTHELYHSAEWKALNVSVRGMVDRFLQFHIERRGSAEDLCKLLSAGETKHDFSRNSQLDIEAGPESDLHSMLDTSSSDGDAGLEDSKCPNNGGATVMHGSPIENTKLNVSPDHREGGGDDHDECRSSMATEDIEPDPEPSEDFGNMEPAIEESCSSGDDDVTLLLNSPTTSFLLDTSIRSGRIESESAPSPMSSPLPKSLNNENQHSRMKYHRPVTLTTLDMSTQRLGDLEQSIHDLRIRLSDLEKSNTERIARPSTSTVVSDTQGFDDQDFWKPDDLVRSEPSPRTYDKPILSMKDVANVFPRTASHLSRGLAYMPTVQYDDAGNQPNDSGITEGARLRDVSRQIRRKLGVPSGTSGAMPLGRGSKAIHIPTERRWNSEIDGALNKWRARKKGAIRELDLSVDERPTAPSGVEFTKSNGSVSLVSSSRWITFTIHVQKFRPAPGLENKLRFEHVAVEYRADSLPSKTPSCRLAKQDTVIDYSSEHNMLLSSFVDMCRSGFVMEFVLYGIVHSSRGKRQLVLGVAHVDMSILHCGLPKINRWYTVDGAEENPIGDLRISIEYPSEFNADLNNVWRRSSQRQVSTDNFGHKSIIGARGTRRAGNGASSLEEHMAKAFSTLRSKSLNRESEKKM